MVGEGQGRKGKAEISPHLADEATNGEPVVAIVVVGGVNVGAVEVRVVGVVAIVDRTGPIVAVRGTIVQRAAVDVASADKEQSNQFFKVVRCRYDKHNDVWTSGFAQCM